jgi:hypothetical protein
MSLSPRTLLVDNGSLHPAATLGLRALAAKLTERLRQVVEPVSLLHSSSIDPQRLGGPPAEILFPAMERRLAEGQNDFIILPLFFGPSQALTVYLPENLERLRRKFPSLKVTVAPHLYAAGDLRLAQILADHVGRELDETSGASSDRCGEALRVALVDHGSPVAAVTAVRDQLAREVAVLLKTRVAAVAPCSMERRPGPEYDFCAPLLGDLLVSPVWRESRVIVAMQFLMPGRHAGAEGDVASICRNAEATHSALRCSMTKLVAEHPLLIEILADRWKSVLP